MVKKLSFTASLELIPLMEVPGVKQVSGDILHFVDVIVDYLLVPVLDPLELCFLRQLPVALCLRITPCRGLNVPSCRDHFQLSCCVRLTCK